MATVRHRGPLAFSGHYFLDAALPRPPRARLASALAAHAAAAAPIGSPHAGGGGSGSGGGRGQSGWSAANAGAALPSPTAAAAAVAADLDAAAVASDAADAAAMAPDGALTGASADLPAWGSSRLSTRCRTLPPDAVLASGAPRVWVRFDDEKVMLGLEHEQALGARAGREGYVYFYERA
jgi:hypothetical protein